MGLILLEALLALLVLVFIVWWTMFSGRKDMEPTTDDASDRVPERQEGKASQVDQVSRDGPSSSE